MLGTAILHDNQGDFVVTRELDLVGEAFVRGAIPTDASNQYQIRLAWNGVSQTGTPVVSGVYTLRLVLRQNLVGDGETPERTLVNQLR